uniref:Uncharacterized protein n=1 Tax=Arundo donax TaxID=35708 RepID=A0A0A8Z793_ARUDO
MDDQVNVHEATVHPPSKHAGELRIFVLERREKMVLYKSSHLASPRRQ